MTANMRWEEARAKKKKNENEKRTRENFRRISYTYNEQRQLHIILCSTAILRLYFCAKAQMLPREYPIGGRFKILHSNVYTIHTYVHTITIRTRNNLKTLSNSSHFPKMKFVNWNKTFLHRHRAHVFTRSAVQKGEKPPLYNLAFSTFLFSSASTYLVRTYLFARSTPTEKHEGWPPPRRYSDVVIRARESWVFNARRLIIARANESSKVAVWRGGRREYGGDKEAHVIERNTWILPRGWKMLFYTVVD